MEQEKRKMGMDLTGVRPENKEGREFSANLYWWEPLVHMAHEADEKTARRCPQWWLNDGAGLDAADARTLGRRLRQAVEDGVVEREAGRRNAVWREQREVREGTVPAHWEIQDARGQPDHGINREKTLAFAAFMESSGGFAIR
jgi:hypothetical protein